MTPYLRREAGREASVKAWQTAPALGCSRHAFKLMPSHHVVDKPIVKSPSDGVSITLVCNSSCISSTLVNAKMMSTNASVRNDEDEIAVAEVEEANAR